MVQLAANKRWLVSFCLLLFFFFFHMNSKKDSTYEIQFVLFTGDIDHVIYFNSLHSVKKLH